MYKLGAVWKYPIFLKFYNFKYSNIVTRSMKTWLLGLTNCRPMFSYYLSWKPLESRKLCFFYVLGRIPAGIYLFKVNNRNARASCKVCSKLTVKTPEQRHRYCSGVFIVVNSEHNSHLVLVFLSLTSNI